MPNLLQTGAGSPTGMVVYEGSLLPAEFRNQIIHSDAGPNVVRSYPVQKNGAGYTAEIINILKGEKDQWFRPADVCIAPDGSLIIADWYDVGVGGHQAGDQVRGRIYRVAPTASAYTITKEDYTTARRCCSRFTKSKSFNTLSCIHCINCRWVIKQYRNWKNYGMATEIQE